MTVWLKTELGKTRCLVNPAHYKHLEMRIPDVSILTMNPKTWNRILWEIAKQNCVGASYLFNNLCFADV